jgi:hypothetical protein
MILTIGDCNKCSEQVQEGTRWDISIELGFTCENCNKTRVESRKSYIENANWMKKHNYKVSEQLKN